MNTVGIEIVAEPGAEIVPLTAGLADEMFEHDGQITKRDIRAATLAALAPRRGEMLWDIGAGSGSIGIEWMLRHPQNRAIAIEAKSERAARIARNAARLGVPDLAVVEGTAPDALAGLPSPDAVFVGGGASRAGVLDAAWDALAPGGRLVVNAVTLETQAELIRRYEAHGGELVTMQIAVAEALGGFHGFRPALPVMRWTAAQAMTGAHRHRHRLPQGLHRGEHRVSGAPCGCARGRCANAARCHGYFRQGILVHQRGQARRAGPRRSRGRARPEARAAAARRARGCRFALRDALAAGASAARPSLACRSRGARRRG